MRYHNPMDWNDYKSRTLKGAVSPYVRYCDGYGNSGSSGNNYILGLTIGVGVKDVLFSHKGSQILDEISAFDLAETDGPYIGQLNMSNVSSFCGPNGLIWGYDLARNEDRNIKPSASMFGKTYSYKGAEIIVHDAMTIVEASERLFGTVDVRRYTLFPGSHVPFAGRNIKISRPGTAYAAIAIGIAKNRQRDACLLMEDVGILECADFVTNRETVLSNLIRSILEIGANQRVEYSECFVGMKNCKVKDGQVGCALVAAPFFTIAKDAVVKNNNGKADFQRMTKTTLEEWSKEQVSTTTEY
jgi:histidine decarboxylase